VLYLEEFKCLVVSNGGDGKVQFFSSESLKLNHTLDLRENADNLRYDPVAKNIFVGYGSGALAIVNAKNGQLITSVRLPAHPESFELEPSGTRIFVNVPEAGQIIVIDREKKAQISSWNIKGMRGNFPMATDWERRRIFIGFRNPAKLVVLNLDTGREIAMQDCVSDADDIFYDPIRHYIYACGGGGEIDVFSQEEDDYYTRISRIQTAPGARTSLLVPELKVLYVAIPRLLIRATELRVYGIK
jgi:hypothetical protein